MLMINDILFHSNANFCVNFFYADFSFLFSFSYDNIVVSNSAVASLGIQ